MHCANCGKSLQRKNAVLVKKPDGGTMLVGRDCAKDFKRASVMDSARSLNESKDIYGVQVSCIGKTGNITNVSNSLLETFKKSFQLSKKTKQDVYVVRKSDGYVFFKVADRWQEIDTSGFDRLNKSNKYDNAEAKWIWPEIKKYEQKAPSSHKYGLQTSCIGKPGETHDVGTLEKASKIAIKLSKDYESDVYVIRKIDGKIVKTVSQQWQMIDGARSTFDHAKWAKDQPKDGDFVARCGDFKGPGLHWWKIPPVKYQFPDGTKGFIKWIVSDDKCFEKYNGNVRKMKIVDIMEWTGDDPVIPEIESN